MAAAPDSSPPSGLDRSGRLDPNAAMDPSPPVQESSSGNRIAAPPPTLQAAAATGPAPGPRLRPTRAVRRLPMAAYARAIRNTIANYADERHPFYASFKVTLRCRFSCEFCNIWKGPKPEMSTGECLRVLQNLGRSSIVLCSFEGGEPLLRDDIEELLAEAHRQPFYLLFTTSQRNLLEYPWERYQKYVDFLHISIDEGHRNLAMFDLLPEIVQYDMVVCVQTVVRTEDLPAMEQKVSLCHESGAKILLMPAVHLPGTQDHFPVLDAFEAEVKRLKRAFPRTVITPDSYFRQVRMPRGGCSPNSIIIDSDGTLYYPCRTLERKAIRLQDDDLDTYLRTAAAREARHGMKACDLRCGWYQYFATSRFTRLGDFVDALGPYARDFLAGALGKG